LGAKRSDYSTLAPNPERHRAKQLIGMRHLLLVLSDDREGTAIVEKSEKGALWFLRRFPRPCNKGSALPKKSNFCAAYPNIHEDGTDFFIVIFSISYK
jgi:hypothetical protein